jgi:hypothetical protein
LPGVFALGLVIEFCDRTYQAWQSHLTLTAMKNLAKFPPMSRCIIDNQQNWRAFAGSFIALVAVLV